MNAPPPLPESHQRPWKHALREAGKGLGCVVLVALLVLALVVVGGIVSVDLSASRVAWTELHLRQLETALRAHHEKTGRFPGEDVGLRALVDEGLLRELSLDAWGNPFIYTVHGEEVEVGSLGEDGLPGGEGEDADLVRRVRAR